MTSTPLWLWVTFVAVVTVALAVDLLAHRRNRVIGFAEAARWSIVWVSAGLAFGGLVTAVRGTDAGVEYTSAWLLEKSLSVDNLFVFALIFAHFGVPRQYQHRVLFFGVLGALVFRAVFLSLGVAVVSRFTVILFVFAALLIWSAARLSRGQKQQFDPARSLGIRLLRRLVPVRDTYAGSAFFVRETGRLVATPLLAVVAAVEAADLMFAIDSVPAVLAVSSDPFIVYTSNVFAILGLRALYFLLDGLLARFRLLSRGLALILAFIGVKLALQAAHKSISPNVPEIPSPLSLTVIIAVLTTSLAWSLLRPAPTSVSQPVTCEPHGATCDCLHRDRRRRHPSAPER
ncbi:TerC family protein [Sporichthya polymorpha]|uniref:TerC family protein n=1 Tax=Sporichthya polymorpha TaxID=35751 RepID=UPI0003A4CB5D|nr:TerC family protein [Sporichthya polymorpha]